MQVFEIINTDVEPIRDTDSSAEALKAMESSGISVIPIIDHTTRKLIGMVSNLLVKQDETVLPVNLVNADDKVVLIDPDAHIFDAARQMIDAEAALLPVADDSKNFLGVITRSELMAALTKMLNVNEPGTVLTIELDKRDFTLSEMVRLTEEEGAKILGITVEAPDATHDSFRISMKLNKIDVSRVTAALNRYGYIITQNTREEVDAEDLHSRADEFLRYLNI